ncbi:MULTISPECIES: tyrosine-type recombinase/integrase [unclassified Phyllobacterium]|uniref:tyrosine-type recombinase/integrase n=1 Tax=unclassified Phyllobacterium TaxID=2638441 RepID=UPI003012F5E8
MPQTKKGPRLFKRKETSRRTGIVTVSWVIKDDGRQIRTGCAESDVEQAERKLADYITSKYTPIRGGSSNQVSIADVLIVYKTDKADTTAQPKETEARIARLNEFFGTKAVADIKGKLCREFVTWRKTAAGARRDLEVLRAATNYYHAEHGLDVLPKFTLPEKSQPRERWLTRHEAALLLWAALGWEIVRDEKTHKPILKADGTPLWIRRRDQKRKHLSRLILIGLYTGTRPGAILGLQWIANTEGGWIDLDRGVLFRKAEGERVAHNKRKTPVKLARRLAAHMRRWKKEDKGLRYVVNYNGESPTKINKAFRSAIAACGLDSTVTPHVLRHTRGTWLANSGVSSIEAAASLGLTQEEYERTYLHSHPDFQKNAADAY